MRGHESFTPHLLCWVHCAKKKKPKNINASSVFLQEGSRPISISNPNTNYLAVPLNSPSDASHANCTYNSLMSKLCLSVLLPDGGNALLHAGTPAYAVFSWCHGHHRHARLNRCYRGLEGLLLADHGLSLRGEPLGSATTFRHSVSMSDGVCGSACDRTGDCIAGRGRTIGCLHQTANVTTLSKLCPKLLLTIGTGADAPATNMLMVDY